MTSKAGEGKFNAWHWLLFTQYWEVFHAPTPAEEARELIDVMAICLERIEKLGFNPVEVMKARSKVKWDSQRKLSRIFALYDENFKRVMAEAQAWEGNNK